MFPPLPLPTAAAPEAPLYIQPSRSNLTKLKDFILKGVDNFLTDISETFKGLRKSIKDNNLLSPEFSLTDKIRFVLRETFGAAVTWFGTAFKFMAFLSLKYLVPASVASAFSAVLPASLVAIAPYVAAAVATRYLPSRWVAPLTLLSLAIMPFKAVFNMADMRVARWVAGLFAIPQFVASAKRVETGRGKEAAYPIITRAYNIGAETADDLLFAADKTMTFASDMASSARKSFAALVARPAASQDLAAGRKRGSSAGLETEEGKGARPGATML